MTNARPVRRATWPVIVLLAAALVVGTSCRDAAGPGGPEVATIEIRPPDPRLGVGGTLPFEAVLRDAAGDVLTGRDIVWTTENAAMLRIDARGFATALAPGQVRIAANAEGRSTTTTVTIVPKAVAAVTVSPPSANLLVGGTVQLGATVTDADGGVLDDRTVAWSSEAEAVATVDEHGLVTAHAPGSATIVATSEGKRGIAIVAVERVPVAGVTLASAPSSLVVGQTAQLAATPVDAAGQPLADRIVAWRSSDERIATVSSAGLVTAVAPGTVTITATSEGKSASAAITIVAKPVSAVVVSPATATLTVGQTRSLSATVTGPGGEALPGRPVTWTSTPGSVATVSAQGVVTAVGPGTATITASSEGKTGTATITVIPVPVASVDVDPSSLDLVVGAQETITATPRDESGEALAGRAITWSTNNAAVATVSASGVVTARAPGSAIVTATSEGRTGIVAVTVRQVPVATVTVSPPEASIAVGGATALTAALADAQGNPLAGRVISWTSSDERIAIVSSSGRVVGIAPGTATITANAEGREGSATVTVTVPPVATVQVTRDGPPTDGTVSLTAAAFDARGAPLSLADRRVSWRSSDDAIATVTPAAGDPAHATVTAHGSGTVTITATVDGVEGALDVQFAPPPPPTVGSVTVSPPKKTIHVGDSFQLNVSVRDPSGEEMDVPVTWSSSRGDVATVDASGLVRGVKRGSSVVTATAGGKSDASEITVKDGK